jgi:hypothetical protein
MERSVTRVLRTLLPLAITGVAGAVLAAQQTLDPRTVPGVWKPRPTDEPSTTVRSAFVLNFYANDLGCVFDNASPWGADAESTMYLEPLPPDSTLHGFPVLRQCVLITHRTAPFFAPVSQERVMGVWIAKADAGVATMKEVARMLAAGTLVDDEVKRRAAESVASAEAGAKEAPRRPRRARRGGPQGPRVRARITRSVPSACDARHA